jgi:tetratricopeptide (TPR) repeat protein
LGPGVLEEFAMAPEDCTSAAAEFDRAIQLRSEGRYEEALESVRSLFTAPLPQKQVRRAHSLALTCAAKLEDWPELEAISREAIAHYPQWPEFPRRLGEALMRQRRFSEAERALQAAIDLNPGEMEAPLLLELCHTSAKPARPAPRIALWPGHQASFDNPRKLMRQFVLGRRPKTPMIGPDDVFMTLGSCFAQNIAIVLRKMKRKVHSQEIGEDVNSTYANRYLLEWIEFGATDGPTRAIEAAYGPKLRKQLRGTIAGSDVFVITLGVAPCFFHRDTGEFGLVMSKMAQARQAFQADHLMRTTSVEENVENIRCILDAITRLARRPPKFVLTVSPVALGGTTERESAVVGDCVSKSILRVAADQICTTERRHQVVYWPSFEMVRWLGPHYGPEQGPAFAAEDANTRHVSAWLVRLIVELFLEHHAGMPGKAAAREAALA